MAETLTDLIKNDIDVVPISKGGTGATTKENAAKNIFGTSLAAADAVGVPALTSGWASVGYLNASNMRTWLGGPQFLGYITNLNTNYTTNGVYMYCFTNAASNKPSNAYGFVIEAVLTSNASIQIAFTHDSTKMYKRAKTSGTWDATWKSLTFS